ncbi:Periplasmic Sensor Hybrid Histidine Kinase [Lentisphaera araneosa HTCC2155]|uniref:histidine kinase n=1 Tax=Lentisphaera araneosa HTCC2155 TaxID=313628 RepID=A6DTE3_9BACT|nr:response regulator [Lentisphaera araneosa]EDM25123.1 Periplasmic Sensor Hybrid Histidine Kinase [Lentisphaera araneosa HTCC2155]
MIKHLSAYKTSISFMVFIGITLMVGAGYIISINLSNLGHKSFQNKADIRSQQLQKEISSHLTQHTKILQDFAQLRIFSQAVLQPEQNAEEAQSLMNSWKLLGEHYPLYLVDFEGNLIRSSTNANKTFIMSPAIKSILNETLDQNLDLIKQEPHPRIRLSVAIKHNEFTEGALIAELPLAEVYQNMEELLAHSEGLQIFHKNHELRYLGPNIPRAFEQRIDLGKGFWANIYFDYSPFIKTRNSALAHYLLIAFVVSIIISTIGFLIINHLFVKPLNALETHFSQCQLSGSEPKDEGVIVQEFDNLKILFDQLISALQNRSENLETINSEMEQLVHQRTKELTSKIGELQKMSEFKSQFFANMSHEIRTPMNAIHGYAELLRELDLDEDAKNYCDSIYQSTKSLLMIINEILDFSKILEDKSELNLRVFNFNELLRSLRKLFESSCTAKGLKLNFTLLDESTAWLKGDKDRIRQVLVNLISNSIKFTEKGSVDINCYYLDNHNTAQVHVQVKDSGMGIGSETLNAITKGHHLSSKNYGLGLKICQDLLKQMKTTLNVQSQENIGSSFEFELVLEKMHHPVTSAKKAIDFSALGYKPNILVVDDNRINLELVKDCLKGLPLNCHLKSSGQAALDFMESNPTDLILMDCQMPQMNGFEATDKLRSKGVEIPIIAFSANAFKDNIEECYKVGMNDYIVKPFEKQDFLAKILQWLKEKKLTS